MMTNLIFIHGMGTPWGMWLKFIAFFEKAGFRCFAPQLPYRSSPNISQEEKEALAKQTLQDDVMYVEEYIKGLNLSGRIVVVGWSRGALLAQKIAERNEWIAGLILISPAAPRGIWSLSLSAMRSYWSAFVEMKGGFIPIPRFNFWRRAARQTKEEFVYSMTSKQSHIVPQILEREYKETVPWESVRGALPIGFDLWPLPWRNEARVDFSKVQCPILIFAGSKDRLTPFSSIKRLAEKYQESGAFVELKIWEGRGHLLYGEPLWKQEIGEPCLRFLSRFS